MENIPIEMDNCLAYIIGWPGSLGVTHPPVEIAIMENNFPSLFALDPSANMSGPVGQVPAWVSQLFKV